MCLGDGDAQRGVGAGAVVGVAVAQADRPQHAAALHALVQHLQQLYRVLVLACLNAGREVAHRRGVVGVAKLGGHVGLAGLPERGEHERAVKAAEQRRSV